jgi:hypothetical protein
MCVPAGYNVDHALVLSAAAKRPPWRHHWQPMQPQGLENTLPGCNAVQQTTGALHFCNDSLTATAEPASQLRSDFH